MYINKDVTWENNIKEFSYKGTLYLYYTWQPYGQSIRKCKLSLQDVTWTFPWTLTHKVQHRNTAWLITNLLFDKLLNKVTWKQWKTCLYMIKCLCSLFWLFTFKWFSSDEFPFPAVISLLMGSFLNLYFRYNYWVARLFFLFFFSSVPRSIEGPE